jgi:hypothetical protein
VVEEEEDRPHIEEEVEEQECAGEEKEETEVVPLTVVED